MSRWFVRVAWIAGCSGALLGGGSAAATAHAPSPGAETSTPSLGLLLDRPLPDALLRPAPGAPTTAIPVRLIAHWDQVEREPGVFDWSGLEPAIAGLHHAGHSITLCLTGSNLLYLEDGRPPSPLDGASLDAWLAFARNAVRTFAGEVGTYEIWDGPARADERTGLPLYDPEIYAFVLKESALAARAEAEAFGARIRVAQGKIGPAALEWQRELWDGDIAAYVDVLPVALRVEDGVQEQQALSEIYAEVLAHPPAPAFWVYLEPTAGTTTYATLKAGIRALAAGASTALAALPEDSEPRARVTAWTLGLQRVLSVGFGPAPLGDLRLVDATGRELHGAAVLARFLSDRDFTSLVVYDGPATAEPLDPARLIVDSARVRNARTVDPVTGEVLRTAAQAVADRRDRRSLQVPLRPYPMLLLFQKATATPGFELPPEELEVESKSGLTAEEIIARFQAVHQIQEDRLERFMGRGRLDFHFKLAQGGSTVDVTVQSNYFWERGGHLEWEQTEYFINGNLVRWKNIPQLPLIQPEKVITLPLDLTLDKTYGYRLVGEDRVDEREAYVLAFQPVDPGAPRSLYRGRLWIDKRNFQRLKASLVQTHLEAPVVSNQERDFYEPHTGPDGHSYWLLSRVDGQQIWTAGGRSFVVRRELSFSDFEINPPREEFEERRKLAYASSNQMMRDTDQGYRYLERHKDGSRTVKEKIDTSQWFAAAGAFSDGSTDVTPLAGANYFDYNLFGKNIQFDFLFAGAFLFVNLSKPDVFHSNMDFTAEASATAISFNRKVFVDGEESKLERIETQPQDLSLRLGIPVGKFSRINLIGDLTHRSYSTTGEQQDLLGQVMGATFDYQLPQDHLQTTASLELEYNRRGYSVVASGSWSSRSDWDEFGLFDVNDGTFVEYTGGDVLDATNYDDVPTQPEAHDTFTRWGLSVFKEWYLPKFQKVRAEANYLDGADLDQFSLYSFSFFGDDRLNGFSGSGVRFDQGTIARAGYAFNLFEAIRFDAVLESARVKEDAVGVYQRFTGLGLSGNFLGPWKTIVNLNYGLALASDIPSLKGAEEFLLLILKLF